MNMNAKNNMKYYGIKSSGINTSWLDDDNAEVYAQNSSTNK